MTDKKRKRKPSALGAIRLHLLLLNDDLGDLVRDEEHIPRAERRTYAAIQAKLRAVIALTEGKKS